MLKKFFTRFVLGCVGFASTFVAIKELFPAGLIRNNSLADTILSFGICVVAFFLVYFFSSYVFNNFSKFVDKLEAALKSRKYSAFELLLGCIGLVIGLIIANLLCAPLLGIQFVGIPITLILNVSFAALGFSLVLRFKQDKFLTKLRSKFEDVTQGENNTKILDTSVIIDGRIYDILLTGFMEGDIVIPQFVIDELGTLADSEDGVKRSKGKLGLDLLQTLQKEFPQQIVIRDYKVDAEKGVDELLMEIAQKERSVILTNDYNLHQIAKLRNLRVRNINALANALKPLAKVGDQIAIEITKAGKERQQGIGYLENGTMVVVEDAKPYVGKQISAVVTSVIQTNAGRMVFANRIE